MFYRWHGHVWSRYPLPVQIVPKGAALHQKNVYLSIPFDERTTPPQIEQLRRGLMFPLTVSPGSVEMPLAKAADSSIESTPLARPGEAGTAVEIKRAVWKALEDCKDAQLYTADINVVELGLIDDVRVRGDVVTIRMMMPHRGRTLAGYFVDGSISVHPTFSQPIRERVSRVPGVRQVVVEQVWEPAWTTNRLTNSGRKKLGLD